MNLKHVLWLAFITMSLFSCKQNDWIDWKTQNELWLTNQLPKVDSNAITTATGLRYRVIADPNPTESRPSKASTIQCDYTVKLINGMQVDANSNSWFSLSTVVAGFAEGITKIHCHGDVMIYVPSDLGYGSEAQGTEGTSSYIPPYSTLIFQVHLSNLTN